MRAEDLRDLIKVEAFRDAALTVSNKANYLRAFLHAIAEVRGHSPSEYFSRECFIRNILKERNPYLAKAIAWEITRADLQSSLEKEGVKI